MAVVSAERRLSLLGRVGAGFAAVPRRLWFGVTISLGLWWVFMYYTRFPAVQRKSDILTVLASGAPNTFNELVSREGWAYWLSWIPTGINMNENNALGMAFAFLIGGAVSSLVLPQGAVNKILFSRGAKGSALGGLLGAPLMMCSACSIPVALGWRKRGANLETTLGVVTGAALLNVMGLLTIWLLFPGSLAWARILASLGMVLLVTPLIVRLSARLLKKDGAEFQTVEACPAPGTSPDAPLAFPVSVDAPRESWLAAARGAVRDWWWASVGIAYRLWIPMTAAIFLAAFLRLFVPAEVVEAYFGGGFIAIALVALFGTLIAVPTMFEIPMTIGFLFLGMGLGPAAALLITAPSVSIVSFFMLRKDVGPLPPLLLLGATWVLGVAAGLLVELGVSLSG